MLFADSDSEGEYFPFGNESSISHLMIALHPGTSLQSKARVFTKHKLIIISTLYPSGMGVAGQYLLFKK